MPLSSKHYRELCELFASIQSIEEADMLLMDLFTQKERDSLTERWQLIKLLQEGVPQREISEKLKVSISKVTRGSIALQKSKGGFKLFRERLNNKKR